MQNGVIPKREKARRRYLSPPPLFEIAAIIVFCMTILLFCATL